MLFIYLFAQNIKIVSSQSTRVTDIQTDGQNDNPQDCASVAASRGKYFKM